MLARVTRVMYTCTNSKSHWEMIAEGGKFHMGNVGPHSRLFHLNLKRNLELCRRRKMDP